MGPIIQTGSTSSNQVEGLDYLRWLDNQPHGSIFYELGNLPRLNMVMDDQNAIKNTFNATVVTVKQSKGHNNSKVPINTTFSPNMLLKQAIKPPLKASNG